MSVIRKLGRFLVLHRKAELEVGEAVAISLGWKVVARMLAVGVAAAAIAVPTMIDLSNNNGPGAAAAISAPGVQAVEAKATEGLSFHDYLYPTFRAAAVRAHKPFGGYLFLHPSLSGKAQADYFLAYATPKPGDLEPVVDSEMGSPCSSAPTTIAALGELAAKGYQPILYSNTYWLGQFARCAPALKAYRVWQAEYGPVLHRVAGFQVIGWQYTDNAGVKGLRIDGTNLLVSVTSLEIPSAKPAPTPDQKKARALVVRKKHLRTLTGYFAWYEWRHGVSRWKGILAGERDARPAVPHRISGAWWFRAALQSL